MFFNPAAASPKIHLIIFLLAILSNENKCMYSFSGDENKAKWRNWPAKKSKQEKDMNPERIIRFAPIGQHN
jgi:hypothetical protein